MLAFYSGKQPPPHFPGVFLFSQSFGFALLARSQYHWQLSFLQAEQVLLEQLDEDGGCRSRCLQALRQMKEDVWCPGKRPVITSHHLQVSGRAPPWRGSSLRAPRGPARATHTGCVCMRPIREGALVSLVSLWAIPYVTACSPVRSRQPGCMCAQDSPAQAERPPPPPFPAPLALFPLLSFGCFLFSLRLSPPLISLTKPTRVPTLCRKPH